MAEELNDLTPEIVAGIATAALIEGASLSAWRKRLATETLNRVMDRLRQSVVNGDDIARAITEAFGGTINGIPLKSTIEPSRRHTQTIVSTAIAAAASSARLAALQGNNHLVKGIQQVSILDNRTSGTCVAYAGQSWDINTLEPIFGSTLPFRNGPPRHFNCRSTLVPILKSWQELGAVGLAMSKKQRNKYTGQPPGDISFDQWLRGKPRKFQERLLGVSRARLWRSGDITLTQLVDMRGNPLTLEQLQQKIKKRRRA